MPSFLAWAMGAAGVGVCKEVEYARKAIEAGGSNPDGEGVVWDWLFVEDAKGQMKKMVFQGLEKGRKRPAVVRKEFAVQSLILGQLAIED
ncbi:hypothetical protein P152DRAFT_457228, partial [Eremomyces bilateralis CBS 781.70]